MYRVGVSSGAENHAGSGARERPVRDDRRAVDEHVIDTELASFGQVSTFPNPTATGQVTLELKLPEATPVRVELYNTGGQQIGPVQEATMQEGQFQLNFAPYAPGHYLVKIITDRRTFTKKVIYLD